VKTRTRNAIAVAAGLSVIAAGLVWMSAQRGALDLRFRALDAVPSGALLVAVGDLAALRGSPLGGPFLREGREIPGLGKVREVCGFDPLDTLSELALAIPAAGDEGDFGLVAAGDVQDEALLACAAKVIEARDGRPVITSIGTFRAVRDATLPASGGEIAVRKGGPVLLGAGAYLRAMIDAVEGRTPTIRSSLAHSHLARGIGGAAVRITVVLTPDQRRTLDEELKTASGSARGSSIVAGALGVELGPSISLHGVILCDSAGACRDLAGSLQTAKDARAGDMGTRIVGFGAMLDQMQIEAKGEEVHARVTVPADEAQKLLERLVALRGMRHPMPRDAPGQPRDKEPPRAVDPPPDEVIPALPAGADAGPPEPRSRDAGAPAAPEKSPLSKARDGG
jgi:hypothetical protein